MKQVIIIIYCKIYKLMDVFNVYNLCMTCIRYQLFAYDAFTSSSAQNTQILLRHAKIYSYIKTKIINPEVLPPFRPLKYCINRHN